MQNILLFLFLKSLNGNVNLPIPSLENLEPMVLLLF